MNLVIDVGNTSVKLAVFQGSSVIFKEILELDLFFDKIQKIHTKYPLLKNAILSSVSHMRDQDVKLVTSLFNTLLLDHTKKMPFANLYSTPQTLGVDRMALIAAAVDQFPKKDVLVIDAGTCITYDFKNQKEEYLGGAIAPGLRLRYASLNNYTSKLPLLELAAPEKHIGNSTNEAIHAGVVNGVLYEIDGAIDEYCNIYPQLTVILTGGHAHFLSKRLKNSIFATSNFLLEGLNHILAYNNSQ
ncbi:type III pantothenate kinase [Aquimarina addita]|uniref:Type III pantothenate kinase n=1 Tax=Aquimarina addita TaxID=870485 RepID=A0ABP6USP6_9FLAO